MLRDDGSRLAAEPSRRLRLIAATLLLVLLAALTPLRATALDGFTRIMTWQAGFADDDLLVVLAIGSDAGPPHRPGDPLTARADGIHLLVVDTDTRRMTIVDIPRDSAIAGGKVNRLLAFGGPDRLEAELEAWSGLPIDFWALGSFWSLEQMVTGMGGLEIDVVQRMNDPFSGTDLQPGVQRLSPVQALAFSRDRKSLLDGDIGRSHNQGRMMRAALAQVQRERSGLQDLMGLVQLFSRSTANNIPPSELLPLALTALQIPPEGIEQVTISGPFGNIGGGSVIYPQPGNLFERLRSGQVGPQ